MHMAFVMRQPDAMLILPASSFMSLYMYPPQYALGLLCVKRAVKRHRLLAAEHDSHRWTTPRGVHPAEHNWSRRSTPNAQCEWKAAVENTAEPCGMRLEVDSSRMAGA